MGGGKSETGIKDFSAGSQDRVTEMPICRQLLTQKLLQLLRTPRFDGIAFNTGHSTTSLTPLELQLVHACVPPTRLLRAVHPECDDVPLRSESVQQVLQALRVLVRPVFAYARSSSFR